MYPSDRRYTKDHEWVALSGSRGRVGITDYAQNQLGDVVFVELPEVGRTVTQGQSCGTIESVKAVSELYCPVSGKVVEVNGAVTLKPEVVNTDPHGTWLIVVELSNLKEVDNLLTSDQYADLVK
ncbi:MAG TPA: glycine cleavage system protein GcvH [Vicinamibacterales bacterium]|jgi:glycine cleavage system H protein|nr:glycine cleavage system protein GcvH [Vicinamibacterales bacterium]